MGIDNEQGPLKRGDTPVDETRPLTSLKRVPLPMRTDAFPITGAASVDSTMRRQPEQQQLQQDQPQRRPETISTGELRRRVSDTGDLPSVTTDQEASAARILILAGEEGQQGLLENPHFIEAADRFFNVMRPHMSGSEEDRDVAAAHAAIIAARNDLYLRGEINRQTQNARLALEKMSLARTQAETDPLTGEYNMRGFNRRLEETLLFGNEPGVVAEFDLNLMKKVNDEFGEDAGDDLIRLAVAAIRAALRATDVVARPKGDEIYAILRGVTLEQAREIIEGKLDAQLQASIIPQLPGQSISLGGGFMEFHPDNFRGLSPEAYEEKVKDMYRQVMAAMKEAKDLSKQPDSPTHRAYIDTNSPKAQTRYEALKQDKTIKVDFDR